VELSVVASSSNPKVTRAMRIIADHARGAVNLLADGVVPSNEDRGYVLRRIMRRAIQQGRVLGLEPPYFGRFAERAVELMGDAYPHLAAEYGSILRWVGDEEESFGRTLERGTELLAGLVAEAAESKTSWIDAEDAFRLHDTYGFPYDLTKELLAEQGLAVDDEGFEALMDRQRERARIGSGEAPEDRHQTVLSFVSASAPARFVGYEELAAQTSVAASEPLEDAVALVKLEESPFYAEGGGQVADSGVIAWEGGEAEVEDVYRVGDDQALRVAARRSPLAAGQRVMASVDHEARHATMRNHTATHLLHAALRERLGTHVRQAGSAVRPDKLRFDFTHGAPLSADERQAIEDRVNEWIKASRPVRALQMGRAEAEEIGAMALFGEKYGDWVRVIEVDEVSRELCGGTHVANTAEVGIFAIVSEGSSAANVRRIEALTGPAAIDLYRERSDELTEAGALLGSARDPLAAARRASERLVELERRIETLRREEAGAEAERLGEGAEEIGGVRVIVSEGEGADQRQLLELADRIKQRAGEAAVVLGGVDDGKVALVASFTKGAVERGLSAAAVIREAAGVVGGGGGGRDDVAQAGGREPGRLGEALEAAREAIRLALSP
jgi:alanyl-tRNA synthetase